METLAFTVGTIGRGHGVAGATRGPIASHNLSGPYVPRALRISD